MIRINRYLSSCGVCSRRAADVLISEGRVAVNGVVMREPGGKLDSDSDTVMVDGVEVRPAAAVHLAFNKPLGVVCSNADGERRRRVIDLLP